MPCVGADRPDMDSLPIPDSPVGFLESGGGLLGVGLRSDAFFWPFYGNERAIVPLFAILRDG